MKPNQRSRKRAGHRLLLGASRWRRAPQLGLVRPPSERTLRMKTTVEATEIKRHVVPRLLRVLRGLAVAHQKLRRGGVVGTFLFPLNLILNVLLTAAVVAVPTIGEAQDASHIPRIGLLSPSSASDPRTARYLDAFRQGLRDLGYVEGQNISIEIRWAEW